MYMFRFIFPVLVTLFIATSIPKPAQAGVLKKTACAVVVSAALVVLAKYIHQRMSLKKEYELKLIGINNILVAHKNAQGYTCDRAALLNLIKEAEAFKKIHNL